MNENYNKPIKYWARQYRIGCRFTIKTRLMAWWHFYREHSGILPMDKQAYDQIKKLIEHYYEIQGTWADKELTKVGLRIAEGKSPIPEQSGEQVDEDVKERIIEFLRSELYEAIPGGLLHPILDGVEQLLQSKGGTK